MYPIFFFQRFFFNHLPYNQYIFNDYFFVCVWVFTNALPLLSCPGSSVGKETAWNAEDLSSLPGSGRSPEEGKGYSLQDSCLENSMDRGSWQATVHGAAESDTIEWLTATWAMQEEIGAAVQLCHKLDVTKRKWPSRETPQTSTVTPQLHWKGRCLQNLGMSYHSAPTGLKWEQQNELLCSSFVCRAFCILRMEFREKKLFFSQLRPQVGFTNISVSFHTVYTASAIWPWE